MEKNDRLVGLVDDDVSSAEPFPAEALALGVQWRSTSRDMERSLAEDGVDNVVVRYQFDDADAAADIAARLKGVQPGTTVWLALGSGKTVVLVQVVTVLGGKASTVHPLEALTARETQVLRMVRAGLTNRDIARSLVISLSTVNRHVEHILLKLHARNRTQAAVLLGKPPKTRTLTA